MHFVRLNNGFFIEVKDDINASYHLLQIYCGNRPLQEAILYVNHIDERISRKARDILKGNPNLSPKGSASWHDMLYLKLKPKGVSTHEKEVSNYRSSTRNILYSIQISIHSIMDSIKRIFGRTKTFL